MIAYYWYQVDGYSGGTNRVSIHSLTPAETITKCRRYIQNDLNMYLPNDADVIDARNINSVAVHSWAIKNKTK